MNTDTYICRMCERSNRFQPKVLVGVFTLPIPTQVFVCPLCDFAHERERP